MIKETEDLPDPSAKAKKESLEDPALKEILALLGILDLKEFQDPRVMSDLEDRQVIRAIHSTLRAYGNRSVLIISRPSTEVLFLSLLDSFRSGRGTGYVWPRRKLPPGL